MQRTFVVGLIAALLFVGAAQAGTTLWGVTNGTGDAGWWTGGEIFTVDTGTGAVSTKATYDSSTLLAFGDIAVRNNGEVYVTYYGQDGFDKLAKVNTSDWSFDWIQDLGGSNDQVNALTFVGDKLYGVTGGGIAANLIEFSLTGSGATKTNLGSLGTNSDGDLATHLSTGTTYYTSWETGSKSDLSEIVWSPVSKTNTKEISTSSGWAGLAFTGDTLWAGTYNDQNLYTLNYGGTSPIAATVAYDLSADLGGNITGLDVQVPEPVSMIFFGTGLVGVAGLVTRRRMRKAA